MRSSELPGGPLPEWQLFEEQIQKIDGKPKVVGFTAPDKRFYPLEEGEELVHIKNSDDTGRKTFIRKGEENIPFEVWKEGK